MPARKYHIDKIEFKSGIKIPPANHYRAKVLNKVRTMKLYDCVDMPNRHAQRSLYVVMRRLGFHCLSRKVKVKGKLMIRVWRVKKLDVKLSKKDEYFIKRRKEKRYFKPNN